MAVVSRCNERRSVSQTKLEPGAAAGDAGSLLSVEDLHVHYALRGGVLSRFFGSEQGSVKAVDGVSFALRRGEVLGVVGESGSGKTTLGRAILRSVPVTAGKIHFEGRDITDLSESQVRPLRRRMQMVFQDPNAALNPAMDLLTAVGHPLRIPPAFIQNVAHFLVSFIHFSLQLIAQPLRLIARLLGVFDSAADSLLTFLQSFQHRLPGQLPQDKE